MKNAGVLAAGRRGAFYEGRKAGRYITFHFSLSARSSPTAMQKACKLPCPTEQVPARLSVV
jgi:hypothetical protein